jgi:hypothetical protein
MELGIIIFWVGANSLIGYAVGKGKNMIGGAIALSIFLGPIGWFIAALAGGNVSKCPFCAEEVKPEAIVCKHCGRDLPQPKPVVKAPYIPPSPPPPPLEPLSRKSKIIFASVCVVILSASVAVVVFQARNTAEEKPIAQQVQNVEEPKAEDFRDEPQTLYATVVIETEAHPPYGTVHLHPDMIVLVTGRNSKFARIDLSGYPATIPLSSLDLPQ